MTITKKQNGEALELFLEGRLDTTTAPELEKALRDGMADMNALTIWLYGRLSWNPYEDLDALIDRFCEKVYGPAAEPMRDYYRIILESWEITSKTYPRAVEHDDPRLPSNYVLFFIHKTGIGHAVIDALDLALERAEEPMKDVIGYIRESYYQFLRTYKSW